MRSLTRSRSPLVIVIAIVLSALLASCSNELPTEEPRPRTPAEETQTPAPSEPEREAPDEEQLEIATITGTQGTPSRLGSWTVTVREAEFGGGNDDVEVPSGMRRLKIEVDLTNESEGSLTTARSDWTLISSDSAHQVLEASEREKQGERTFSAGDEEDVTVNFAVPSATESYVLRFEPSEGGPGALEVTLSGAMS
jgi:hypothetical protein